MEAAYVRPMFICCGRCCPLVAVVIIIAAKEEVRWKSMKSPRREKERKGELL